jgi:glutamate formiminotransferase
MLNRREFKRVKLSEPIVASMELKTLSFSNNLNFSGVVHVHVIDISAGGLRFISKAEFFVNYLAIYKIQMNLNNHNLVLLGKLIRKTKLTDCCYEYGIKFEFDLII